MNYKEILQQIKDHVRQYYKKNKQVKLCYHTFGHTKDIVAIAELIGKNYRTGERDMFLLKAAAWFHGVGYLVSGPAPIEQSAIIAKDFLRGCGIDETDLEEIKNCILATNTSQQPSSLIQKTIGDANLHYLGTGQFMDNVKKLRKEHNLLTNSVVSKQEWYSMTVAFITNHPFQTDFCKAKLDHKKAKNLAILNEKVRKLEKKKSKKMKGL